MDQCIDWLGEATVFSMLHVNSGCWEIQIDEHDRGKTILTNHFGLYQFVRMHFGLKHASKIFQRTMDVICFLVKWQSALTYLDYIVVFLKTVKQNLNHLLKVVRLLQNAGVKLRLKHCSFFAKTINCIGHVIKPERLGLAEATTSTIQQNTVPYI